MIFPILGLLLVLSAGGAVWWAARWRRARALLEEHMIDVEDLHRMLDADTSLKVYDVRLPLDLLAYSEIIPGSVRVAPKEIEADSSMIPQNVLTVVYCTCPGDATAREIVGKALAKGFDQTRILRGGLEAWKAKGYPVEPYEKSFRLDTPV